MSAPTSHNVKILLLHALNRASAIRSNLESTEGALTETVFSTPHYLLNSALHDTREKIANELASLAGYLSHMQTNDPIVIQYPNIRYNASNFLGLHRDVNFTFGSPSVKPMKWDEVAKSVFHDVPIVEQALLAALKANGGVI